VRLESSVAGLSVDGPLVGEVFHLAQDQVDGFLLLVRRVVVDPQDDVPQADAM
jgi:hypothetical protein